MKSHSALLLCLFICFHLISCTNTVQDNILVNENTRISKQKCYDSAGKLEGYMKFVYTDTGYLNKIESYSNDQLVAISYFEHNDKNLVSKLKNYTVDNTLTGYCEYSYNQTNELEKICFYDSSNSLIGYGVYVYKSGIKDHYNYYRNSILSFTYNLTLENGLLVQSSQQSTNNTIISNSSYKYENNKLIKCTILDSLNVVLESYEFDYEAGSTKENYIDLCVW